MFTGAGRGLRCTVSAARTRTLDRRESLCLFFSEEDQKNQFDGDDNDEEGNDYQQ